MHTFLSVHRFPLLKIDSYTVRLRLPKLKPGLKLEKKERKKQVRDHAQKKRHRVSCTSKGKSKSRSKRKKAQSQSQRKQKEERKKKEEREGEEKRKCSAELYLSIALICSWI